MIPGKVPDAQTQESFVEKILSTIEEAREGQGIVVFIDPVHQVHNNENDYVWQLKGKEGTKTVSTNTGRRRLNIIGALNPVNLKPTVLLAEGSCNKEVMQTFLKQLKQDYPQAEKITAFLDNAGYNRAYEVQDLAQELNINLSYLPPYCPNLNLIERLWKFFKKQIMKNTYYPSYNLFYQAVTNFFKNFEIYKQQLTSLITFNFQIIKAC